ncbi:MAG: beta-galactosidase [Chloroflexota bacterium]
MIVPRVPHLLFGADYNPEQWPETVWEEDVRLMQQARVNLVSLGIFAWALLEPEPGRYAFDWLDRIMDLLHRHGVMVDLATATSSPPAWLTSQHPEILPVTQDGLILSAGSRQHYCPSSPAYREAAATLVRAIAHHYRHHPALALWHSNNEYGCHVSACYCDTSAADFRDWLRRRYGTIEALNDAWGTAFWSQRYGDWREISPPRTAPTFVNPTQQLDFQRFSSDALLACFEIERKTLKDVTPDIPVTTNFMNFFKPLDYWKWAGREDIVSNDSYPDPSDPDAPLDAAMSYDLMRSLGHGRPWILMEQTPSQVNWRPTNALKRPGQMRLWSYQALARGADGVMFFQWRASPAGAEKFHGAVVPHGGTDGSRVWQETVDLGRELYRLTPLLDARTPSRIAILFDWDNWWALELDSKPSMYVRMLEQIRTYYAPLFHHNISVDFVRPGSDLSGYRVVLVPNLYLVSEDVPESLEKYVEGGGILVMSFFSGIVNSADRILLGGYPAPFRRLLGIKVEEFDPYPVGHANRIRDVDGRVFPCDLWSDVIALEGADALAWFEEDFYADLPAVTRHRFGQGVAYYLGTRPGAHFLEAFLSKLCRDAAVMPALEAPRGVEVTVRVKGNESYIFLLNHTTETIDVPIPEPMQDLLTGEEHVIQVRTLPFGVAVLHTRSIQ